MQTYIVTSEFGNRKWEAEDEDHAREQHLDAFPDEEIESIKTESIIVVRETGINRTENYRLYDLETPIHEFIEEPEHKVEALYKLGMEYRYGRCTSKVYEDVCVYRDEGGEDWETIHVGYCFEKRVQYDDSNETFLREIWLSFGRRIPAKYMPGLGNEKAVV